MLPEIFPLAFLTLQIGLGFIVSSLAATLPAYPFNSSDVNVVAYASSALAPTLLSRRYSVDIRRSGLILDQHAQIRMADLAAHAISIISRRNPNDKFASFDIKVGGQRLSCEFLAAGASYGLINRDAENVMQWVAEAINGKTITWDVLVRMPPFEQLLAHGRIGPRW